MDTASYSVRKVGIVGGGTMGSDLAALFATEDINVVVKEVNADVAALVKEKIDNRFNYRFERGKISRSRLGELKSYVQVTEDPRELSDVNLLIEAVSEDLDLKIRIFKEFDEIVPEGAIMASNTSALPIAKLSAATRRGDRVLGMHFFNPPTKMPLIEIIPGPETSEEVLSAVENFSRTTLKKVPIRVADKPAFLVNRLLMPYLAEAMIAIGESRVPIESIDAEAKKFGWPMGPFILLDKIGLDIAEKVAEFIVLSYSERMKLPPVLDMLVKMKRLGMEKGGAGFYVYEAENQKPLESILEEVFPNRRTDVSPQEVFERMMTLLLNEAALCLMEGIASKEDIEIGALAGIGFPQDKIEPRKSGPLHFIDKMGIQKLLADLKRFEGIYGNRFKPCELLIKNAENSKKFFGSRF